MFLSKLAAVTRNINSSPRGAIAPTAVFGPAGAIGSSCARAPDLPFFFFCPPFPLRTTVILQ